MKISVIIPVYNASKYIKDCLNSIQKQTLSDLEIIVVDDGSTDNSLKIIETYAKKDKRIKIIHQENKGAGEARNTGLKNAQGDYILFLDSDDFFEKNLCERVYEKAIANDADIVVYGSRLYDNKNKVFIEKSFVTRKASTFPKVFNASKVSDKIYNFAGMGPCNKLLRRTFLSQNNLEFPSLANSEDVYFTMMALTLAKRICLIDDALYNYRVNLNSNLQSLNNHQDAILYAWRSVYDELKRRHLYSKVEKSFVNAALSSISYNVNSIIDKPELLNKFYKTLNSPIFLDMNLLSYPESYYRNKKHFNTIMLLLIRARYLETRGKKVRYEIEKDSSAKTYKVSVVVPIYNVELYLEECLDSLVKQTLKEVEVVCVNDASTDTSLDIAMKYAKEYKNVKVINHLNNGGLSVSRNTGLIEAKGEYIYFLDSDDYLELDALEKCYKLAHEKDLDSVYFNTYLLVDGDVDDSIVASHRRYYERKNKYPKITTGIDLYNRLCQNKEYSVSACVQISKKDFLISNDLFFHEGTIHEDEPFFLMALLLSKKVGYLDASFYQRRLRPLSIMTTNVKFKNVLGLFTDWCELMVLVKQVDDLTEDETISVNKRINSWLKKAKRLYREISNQERKEYLKLDSYEKILFKYVVVNNSYGLIHVRRAIARRIGGEPLKKIVKKLRG